MQKIDFKKDLKHLYGPKAKDVAVVDVPAMNFLMIDGEGDPNTAPAFAEAIEALYGVSYTLKFTVKKGDMAIDYGVMPLEALWWGDDPKVFTDGRKDEWKWTVMIMQPEFITAAMVDEAMDAVEKKKSPPALRKLRFESFAEGPSAQILYVGPYDAEGPTIARLHDFIESEGGQKRGHHHEIYLNDARRTAPEKLKTVIRQPFDG